ncbi:MAG TPA: WYL domain-containing protein, partial [Anaeromyxobacteraceae bacterium]|nr:WYL domain-containing protein [Anaeromyxobacteraceae bacterium]
VLFLVPYAVRHPGIPVKELAQKCGIDEKELLEDLDFLLGVGCPPFAPDDFLDLYVEGDAVHVALHQSFSRPPRFTESEAAALAAAAQALAGEGAGRVVRALRESVPRDRRELFDELVHRIYAGSAPARDSLLGRIQRAIAERRVLRLGYFAATRGAEGERTVRPWTLAQALGHWYLYGEEAGRRKAFRLDRIKECSLSEERFEPPPEAELEKARLFSEPRAAARVKLGRKAAAVALSRPGRYRVVKRTAGGGAVVELQVEGEDYATRFALSYGADAQMVSPPAARRHYAETVRRTLARYRR